MSKTIDTDQTPYPEYRDADRFLQSFVEGVKGNRLFFPVYPSKMRFTQQNPVTEFLFPILDDQVIHVLKQRSRTYEFCDISKEGLDRWEEYAKRTVMAAVDCFIIEKTAVQRIFWTPGHLGYSPEQTIEFYKQTGRFIAGCDPF